MPEPSIPRTSMRDKSPDAFSRARLFDRTRLISALALAAALVVCLIFAWSSRDAMAQLPFLRRQTHAATSNSLVDLRPWQTAEDLSAMAVTAEEQEYAHQAERLADHEVDQAFAAALRQAQTSAQHRKLKGEALTLSQKAAELQKVVNDDQARVQTLTQAAAQSPAATTRATETPDTSNPVSDDLELAKAQLGLDSDELADAEGDLARATGDERGRLQQELADHEADMKKYDSEAAARRLSAVATSRHYGTLARRLAAWFDQRTRYQLLQQAAQQASVDSGSLTSQHNQMEGQTAANANTGNDRESRLNAMRSRAMQSQVLSIFDDRIQTEQQLAGVYQKWASQVLLQHQIVFHLLMESFALIAFILICALLLDAFMRFLLERLTLNRRMPSYRLISRLAIEFVSAALILLVIFGTPSEMPTIVGLTTAGLTVVLQDFIISFCGWFVLMGKHGIRVGDWVEINGVGGEVVDIGLFRTHLIETGNWTDHGHPTGRRVAFTNSFAIKGQYFNFTTSGQWMWDEITVTVPNSDDAYGTIELIHKVVLEATDKESDQAEQEWKLLGRGGGLNNFSAAAAVNMRPSAGGIDIIVRYVTRASKRYEVRNIIYQRVIELMHKPSFANTDSEATTLTSSG